MRGEVLELVDGRRRAVIDRRGASLLGLQDDGVDLIQPAPADADPALVLGATLAPWPNRVRGAQWEHQGRRLELAATEPAAGNALHGLVTLTDFTVRAHRPDQVRLATRITGDPGYPFALDLEVTFTLGGDGLHVELTVQNVGAETAPVALGTHPYLYLGGQDLDTLELVVPARATLVLGEDQLPRELMSVVGSPHDLRLGSEVGQMPGHAVYTDFTVEDVDAERPVDGADEADVPEGSIGARTVGTYRIRHHLRGREATLELWTEPRFCWLQVYRTMLFPAPEEMSGYVTALAVEPMTAPPDALNSGIDLEWVAPGATWTVTWGLRLLR